MSKKSARSASSLRSFLRFLHSEGMTRSCLADAVLHAAYWRLSGLARPLDDAQLGALRDACDPSEPVGRRDRAVIAVLSRFGLRCAEAAALQLEDVDWPDGTITVHGKGNRTDRLPLPVDVGEAVVDYLRHGRPDTVARAVFVRVHAPHTALAPSSVSCIVARAARRAGLGTVHGHRLRHTAASKTLNTGASLEDVALLMRHAGRPPRSVTPDRPGQARPVGAPLADRRRPAMTAASAQMVEGRTTCGSGGCWDTNS